MLQLDSFALGLYRVAPTPADILKAYYHYAAFSLKQLLTILFLNEWSQRIVVEL